MRNILKAAGIDPCPKRAGTTWDEFVSRHAASLWQRDFFSQKFLTLTGIREAFVLAFLHVETRRVIHSPATFHPNEAWVTSQTETIVEQARSQGLRVRYVQRDRDGKYAGFDAVLKRKRVKALKGAIRAPNTHAFVERFIAPLAGNARITVCSLERSIWIGPENMVELLSQASSASGEGQRTSDR